MLYIHTYVVSVFIAVTKDNLTEELIAIWAIGVKMEVLSFIFKNNSLFKEFERLHCFWELDFLCKLCGRDGKYSGSDSVWSGTATITTIQSIWHKLTYLL